MGFTQPRAIGPKIVYILYQPVNIVVQPLVPWLKAIRKNYFWLDSLLIHLVGGGYEIYPPRIEQSD